MGRKGQVTMTQPPQFSVETKALPPSNGIINYYYYYYYYYYY